MAIASPTWTEVQSLSQLEVDAMNIVKGEMNGDKYLWDAKWHDRDGKPHVGAWKSFIESKGSV